MTYSMFLIKTLTFLPINAFCLENSTMPQNYAQILNVGTLFSGLHKQVVPFLPALCSCVSTLASNHELYKPSENQARDINGMCCISSSFIPFSKQICNSKMPICCISLILSKKINVFISIAGRKEVWYVTFTLAASSTITVYLSGSNSQCFFAHPLVHTVPLLELLLTAIARAITTA